MFLINVENNNLCKHTITMCTRIMKVEKNHLDEGIITRLPE